MSTELPILTEPKQLRGPMPSAETRQKALYVLMIVAGIAMVVITSWLIGSTGLGVWVVLGFGAIVTGMSIVNHPPFGLYLLVVFIYLNLSDVLEVAFGIPSINKALIALVAVSILGSRAVIREQPLIFRRAEMMATIYVVAVTLSTFVTTGTANVISDIVDTAKDLIIIIIIVQVSDDETSWKRTQWLLILSAAFLSALTAYQMLTGDTSNDFYGLAKAPVHQIVEGFDSTRPTGPLEDPNFYAQILLMILPLAVYRTIGETTWSRKLLATVCTLLIAAAIIFTYSRSALIMMIVVVFMIIRERKLNVYKIGVLVLLAYVMAIPILPAGYTDRILTITEIFKSSDQQTERSFRGRTSEMIVASRMFLDNPVFGVGYANFEPNYLPYSVKLGLDDRLESREAHSFYLEIASETGLVGIATFTLMISTIFVMLRRARTQLRQIDRPDLIPWLTGLQYGLTAYLFTSIFLHDAYVRYFRLSVALAAGGIAMAEALVQRHQNRAQQETPDL